MKRALAYSRYNLTLCGRQKLYPPPPHPLISRSVHIDDNQPCTLQGYIYFLSTQRESIWYMVITRGISRQRSHQLLFALPHARALFANLPWSVMRSSFISISPPARKFVTKIFPFITDCFINK